MGTEPDLLLGIDSSTQSTKACVWSASGELIAAASAGLTVQSPKAGWAEQDPKKWWSSARAAVRKVLREVDPGRIAALGLAYQRETFALLDAKGRAVRPAILWLDVRCDAEVEQVAEQLGREAYHEATGKPLDVTSVLPRMLWLRRHEAERVAAAARWTDVGAYLAEKLTGQCATCVAGTDTCGLINLHTRTWEPGHLDAIGFAPEQLPRLAAPGEVIGLVTRAAARQTGLAEGLPVVAAGGDGQVFSVGMNAAAPLDVSLTLGTSIVLGVACPDARTSRLYRTLISASSGYLLECVLQSGTYLLRWFAETFAGRKGLADWDEQARAIAPGCEGLMTLPHWWGVRFPEALPDARGATVGWSNHHTLAHFYRSLLEGLSFELKRTMGEMDKAFPDQLHSPVRTGGGGAKSEVWTRMLADVLGRGVGVSAREEVTALGAAVLAGVGVGMFADAAEGAAQMVKPADIMEPDAERARLYDDLFRRCYVPLLEANARVSGELRRLAGG